MPANAIDPLANPDFRSPGLLEKLAETFLGQTRPIDCAQIETTSFCAGGCLYCPHTTEAKGWKARHMSPEVFASLWPLLLKAKRAHLQGWGEPLLNPRFFDFQALAKRAGCHTSTTTCGLAMDWSIAAKLAESGMDLIAFSLVGTDKESNSARAKVPFEKVCDSVKMLRTAINAGRKADALEIHFAYLLLADRMHAVSALPELMDRLDVEMAVISTLDYLAIPAQRELAFHPEDRDKVARAIEILETAAERAEKLGRSIHYELPGADPVANQSGCRENVSRSLYVDAEGDISPCIYLNVPGAGLPRKVFGNSLQKDAMTIWRQQDFRKFRASLLAGNPEECCQRCPKRFEQ